MNVMDVKKNLFRTVISEYEFGRPSYPEGYMKQSGAFPILMRTPEFWR